MSKAKTLSEPQVMKRVEAAVSGAGSQAAFAKLIGISRPYLHDILHRRRAIPDAVLEFVSVKRTTQFEEM